MQPETALLWSWLNILTKKRYDDLCERFGGLELATEQLDEALLAALGCRHSTILTTLNRRDEYNPLQYAEALRQRGICLCSLEDDGYPASLRTIADPPVFLYYRGDLALTRQPCLGLVGTRDMSPYGRRVTELFVPAFVRAGVVTVSGLALGIDALVARETIAAGGRTVAVLGHGLATVYPASNRKLADAIVEAGGLLLSEYPLDVLPDKYTFPARNRIIAGLSVGTLVLEAGEGSGSLITAQLAAEYGRDVFAVPGQIFDEHYGGCHRLIAGGEACLVTSPDAVLQEVGIYHAPVGTASTPYQPVNADEAVVLSQLTSMPQSVTDLVEQSALDAGAINAALLMLELSGVVKNVGGGLWVRCQRTSV